MNATESLANYGISAHWYRPGIAAQRLLLVFAHPDDESFGNAGTIARYAASGTDVYYACATRGEVGNVASELLQGQSIAELRSTELENAVQLLGLAGLFYLNHRDSGMAGTADNQHPDAFVQQPAEFVAHQIAAIIRTIRPQVVITFNAYGGYGHPDHIACHRATKHALRSANDPNTPLQLAPFAPERLYYTTFSPWFLRFGILLSRISGRDPRQSGDNGDVDALRILEELTPTTTSIVCDAFLEQKEAAWASHRSQFEQSAMARIQRIPRSLRRRFLGVEHFTRVIPPWLPGTPRETDLFGGITAKEPA
jgi:mycothiol S-conjugate amidase